MNRAYYSCTIEGFLNQSQNEILGILTSNNDFSLEQTQREAWVKQIIVLKEILIPYTGSIYFEFSIPRMGKRIDVLLIIDSVIFVLEFKVGEKEFHSYSIDQVCDYALDLKNFHKTSHDVTIAPILIASHAKDPYSIISATIHNDRLLIPIKSNFLTLSNIIKNVLQFSDGESINIDEWERGSYCPTPTIIEAAMALYNNHSVADISRSDASAINLSLTSDAVSEIIKLSKEKSQKTLCFCYWSSRSR